jgi:hypothetical protein
MKKSLPIIAVGILVIGFGFIFNLQGQSLVGPETSFMYSNPEWITYGLEILIIGSIILGIGITIKIFRRTS